MKRWMTIACLFWLALLGNVFVVNSANADLAHWPQWRGPFFNGMARTGAPTEFSDTKNVKWKVAIQGRGFSTPVIWGDRVFLTTALPTGKVSQPKETAPGADQQQTQGRRGAGGGAGSGEEHKFVIMCLERKTGKVLWERVAKVATPHEGYHRTYGSFASNAPLTDGKYIYASFGSRGMYCYDLNGKLVWEKDLGIKMRMRLQFGEGTAPALYGNLLIHHYDQESGSFVVALDKRNGKEVWRVSRDEVSSWSTPLVVDHKGQKQVVISATNKVRS
ncbi:MAG: PQQ-binding-like beta-propeller repeat protein, partial [Pyrinomonadaceae bacterium]